MRKAQAMAPLDYVRRFYYDTVVFGSEYLGFLAKKVGASQLIAGTDGPVDIGQPSVAELFVSAGLSPAEQELIAHANAEKLLAA